MLRSYLKIALRGLLKHRIYSLINIGGLAIGVAVTLLIGLWIHYEFSYNRFIPDHDRVFRLKRHYKTDVVHTSNAIPLPLVEIIRENIPGIEYVAEADWGGTEHSLAVEDTRLYLSGTFVGVDFLHVFQLPFRYGDRETALASPNGIVLTASTAKALFGDKDPVNQSVRFDNEQELMVTAVLEDLPSNSSFHFNYLVPFSFIEQKLAYVKEARTSWDQHAFTLYLSLLPDVEYRQVLPKIEDLITENSVAARETEQKLSLQSVSDWHLYGKYENGKVVGGFIEYLRMFGLIGCLVLILACINFMNLATARSMQRAKEVGVRKAIGSKRKHLITQFLSETFLITGIAFGLAILIVYTTLSSFNAMVGGEIHIPFEKPIFWLILFIYLVITALLAGSRPAFYLSSFEPVKVLKGAVQDSVSAFWSRKALVLVQFSCSIALIIGTIIIYEQLQYARSRPTGYDQNRLLMSSMSEDMIRNYDALRDELLKSGVVEDVARSSSSATDITFNSTISNWPGKHAGELPLGVATITVSDNYFDLMGMVLKHGRGFAGNLSANSDKVILNETAVQQMSLTESIGQSITWMGDRQVTIIGVVQDAIIESPYEPAEATLFTTGGFWTSLLYRLKPVDNIEAAIQQLKPIFEKFNPSYPFEYEFVDQVYAEKFHAEVTIGRLAGLFAGLAILVSSLGLFGLATFMAEQRRKEIGIRKVLGADLSQIWMLLSREFIGLVIISCVLAAPIAYFFLQSWLQQFAYRISIRPIVFVWAGILAVSITIITISFQAIRAGTARPVDSLRAE